MDEDFIRQVQLPVLFVFSPDKNMLTTYPRSRVVEFETGRIVPFLYEQHLYIAPPEAIPIIYRAYFKHVRSGMQEVLKSEGAHLVHLAVSKSVAHKKRSQFSLKMNWLVGEWLSHLLKSKPRFHSAITLQLALTIFFGEGTNSAKWLQENLTRWQSTDRLEIKIGQLGINLYRWKDGAQNDTQMPGDLRLRRSTSIVSSVRK